MVNGLYKYPVIYISSERIDFDPTQISNLFEYEKNVGPIMNETDIPGLQMDFNAGLRLQIPKGDFHVIIRDYDSELIFFDSYISEKVIISAEKYYIKWQVEVYLNEDMVFFHILELTGEKVYFYMAGAALGDTIAMLEFLPEFQKKHKCHIYLTPPDSFKEICSNYYPEIKLTDKIVTDTYASYCLATFQIPPYLSPEDSRIWSPYYTGRSMLGLNKNPQHIVYKPHKIRLIKEKYVCIAVQASGVMKRWLNPEGWDYVVHYLKKIGYRVLCIDADDEFRDGNYIIKKPLEAENFTGKLPLMDRINLLAYADFFIGLDSGLSWMAWACNKPVIVISGFSLASSEFDTPYWVTNQLVCHGCHSDIRVQWKKGCPYHLGTEREFECSKKISAKQVINAIERLMKDYNY